jgi:hypothetical protein
MATPEQIVFVQYQEPGLKAGDYRIHAELSVQNLPSSIFAEGQQSDPTPTTYSTEKFLRVAGDRFTLTPGTVDSVYPPENASGNFSRVLPHIVLNRPTLPWERTISDAATDHVPWLAILVVTEEELRAEGLNLINPTERASRLDNGAPVSCELLTLSGALWSKIAPTPQELAYLAHVRQVLPAHKADNPRTLLEYSLVIANRLPSADQSCHAFLVSLEGMKSKLPSASIDEKITVPVLHRWRFFAEKEARSFGTAVLQIDYAVGLNLPHAGAKVAAEPLEMGFTPFHHDLRVGGTTYSWYRGPFTPYGTQRRIKRSAQVPVEWGDAVTFYDPKTGMMDVSCSSAWALGRLMALNDTCFAQTVYKWKRHTVRSTIDRARFRMLTGHTADAGALSTSRRRFVEQSLSRGLSSALLPLGGISPEAATLHIEALPPIEDMPPAPLLSTTARTLQLSRAVTDVDTIATLHHLDQEVHLLRSSLALAAEPEPTSEAIMSKWLGELALLKNIPLHYLVPDERMLPTESIRFFQIDTSWLEAIHDGALSIGRVTDADLSHDKAFHPLFRAQTERATAVARPQARRLLEQGQASPWVQPSSGFLLRSQVITQWPDMEVRGKVGNEYVVTLRQQRIGPMLLCLFDRVVDTVELHQPSEGVHFGFLAADHSSHAAKMHRGPDGKEIPADSLPHIPFRDAVTELDTKTHVLDILALVQWMGRGGAPQDYRSDEFALQMVTGVDRVVFRISNSG